MWKKFSFRVLIFTSLIVLLVGGFNLIVDPFGIRTIDGKFSEYLSMEENFRIHKAKIFSNYPNTIVFGSSRAQRIDPKNLKAYGINARITPISGNTLDEEILIAEYAKNNGKNLILGFDAFTLNDSRMKHTEIINRKIALENELNSKSFWFLSLEPTLISSVKHLLKKIVGKNTNGLFEVYNNESNPVPTFEGIDKHLNLSMSYPSKKGSFSHYDVNISKINTLSQILTSDDIVIIYPKYYMHYLLFDEFQNIETKYFGAIRHLVQNTQASVWCFYGVNPITINPDNFDANGWHFKPKVAELVFAKVFGDTNKTVPADFGVKLTSQNIDAHLAKLKADRTKWRASHPVDVAEIEALKVKK